jgi:CRISPR-associated endonuclease/helicase Cas3
MNVLFVSECNKNALRETRRILDQFAERRGERTWQTPITQAGLDTVRKLLRKTARKNTAVACHWIRGRDHSELLWIVGDAGRFNALGASPTNTTRRNVLRREDEDDWHSLPDIHLLAALAALLHDLGKACKAFQQRLKHPTKDKNIYRHEWVSLRLFQAFVGEDSTDDAWLKRLIAPTPEDDASWIGRLQRDGLDAGADAPLANLPPLAQAVGWLVVTHHRLPVMPSHDEKGEYQSLGHAVAGFQASQLDAVLSKIRSDWNELPQFDDIKQIEPYWAFPKGLPVTTRLWRQRAAKLATRLLERLKQPRHEAWIDNLYVMHLARLALMLADHHYSSLTDPGERLRGEDGYALFANTRRDTGDTNQALDEHLLGVERHAGTVTHAFAGFQRHLPRLVRHKGLRRRSRAERFRWQDRAADVAFALRERSDRNGAFLINMASTGCGKTLANARIMNALAEPEQGLRCAFALGLRTLTLQTGDNFRDLLKLSADELAVRVGGAPSRELFKHFQKLAERSGSESSQSLMLENGEAGHVLYEGDNAQPLLQRAMKDPNVRSLLAAPLLVCTVDHLVPATESLRGGRQIAPMLRLMSGDLVLDELDDFDLADLPALTRLMHWSGLLGARVLVSSATLPPALVEGMFMAYRAGREIYQRNRGERPGEPLDICCAWFDEFGQHAVDCADAQIFATAHAEFAGKRHRRLGRDTVRRRSRLVALKPDSQDRAAIREHLASTALREALALHADHHDSDPHSGKRVSFGLIRMANIEPLVDVALALYRQPMPEGFRIHLCVYHSQYPLLLRSSIEQRLDRALDRRNADAVFELEDIRQRLDTNPELDQLFIVLGSPVTEVGRDHDYDWAIVEPSSMRSLIQLAGRVRRHRIDACEVPNIALLDTNLKHLEQPGKPAYCRPGFEDDVNFRLAEHRLETLLDASEREAIDARPRIVARPPEQQRPQHNLVDLEHARLRNTMLPAPAKPASRRRSQAKTPPLNAASAWTLPRAHLTAVLQQQQPFRKQTQKEVDLVLLPNDDEDDYVLARVADEPGQRDKLFIADDEKNHRIPDDAVRGEHIAPWGATDYMTELTRLADSMEISLETCAKKYGSVSLPNNDQGWRFHPALGFTKWR